MLFKFEPQYAYKRYAYKKIMKYEKLFAFTGINTNILLLHDTYLVPL